MTNKAMHVVAEVLRANSKGLGHPHETTPAYELAVEVLRLERALKEIEKLWCYAMGAPAHALSFSYADGRLQYADNDGWHDLPTTKD